MIGPQSVWQLHCFISAMFGRLLFMAWWARWRLLLNFAPQASASLRLRKSACFLLIQRGFYEPQNQTDAVTVKEFFIVRLHEGGNKTAAAAALLSHDVQNQVFSAHINQLGLFIPRNRARVRGCFTTRNRAQKWMSTEFVLPQRMHQSLFSYLLIYRLFGFSLHTGSERAAALWVAPV